MGDLQARIGSEPSVRLRTRKAQALLAFLAMPAGVPHSRDKLATLLWGDRSLAQARARFRETLFVLRRALASADPPCLVLTGETLALDADAVGVDAGDFARRGDSRWSPRRARTIWPTRSSFSGPLPSWSVSPTWIRRPSDRCRRRAPRRWSVGSRAREATTMPWSA